MRVEVKGVEQLDELAARLRAAGSGGGLRRQVTAALEDVTMPLPQALRSSAGSTLPRRGGLGARVARSRFDVSVQSDAGGVGVHVQAVGEYDLAGLDRGLVRHQVFGRGRLVTQRIRPGWLSRPIDGAVAAVPAALNEAARRVAADITK